MTARHRDEAGWALSAAELAWRNGARAAVADDDAFAEGARSAEGLGVDDAVTMVLRSRGPRLRPPTGWASLTPTELEVVTLAAEGRSNATIAEGLYMSRATVKTHLNHTFAKLGVSTHAELAAARARRRT